MLTRRRTSIGCLFIFAAWSSVPAGIMVPGPLQLRTPVEQPESATRVAGASHDAVPDTAGLPAGTRLLRNVSYGPNAANKMDIYLPPHPTNAAVLLMVHGGAWTTGDKATARMVTNKAAHWVPKGIILISTNYRLLPAADPLEQANDIGKALAFAQAQAKSWGGDASRFVLMGHSAGAHLVTLLAADPTIAFRQGAKPWLGTISLDNATLDVVQTMRAKHYRLYDAAFGREPNYWEKASPIHRLNGTPQPLLLVCSTRRSDPCPQARQFAAKIESLGGKATVIPLDLSHREINEELGLARDYTKAVDSFLQSIGLP